ncbi:GNAT family N-acetyltransferase [Salibacterium sp. K-3]
MSDIQIGENKFFMEKDGENVAEITFYHDNDSNIVIDHTGVDEELRGQGIAKELVANVVDKARAENKQIIPECPYAEKQLKKNDAYRDVLATA